MMVGLLTFASLTSLKHSLSSDWTMLTRMGSDDEQSFQTPAEKESARRMAEAMVHFREVLAQPTIDIGSHTHLPVLSLSCGFVGLPAPPPQISSSTSATRECQAR